MGVLLVNVVQRGRILHFRRSVPADLRPSLRRRELTRSLETGHTPTARLRAAQLYMASEHLFDMVHTTPMLADAQLARLVQDFYATILERENAVRLRAAPHDDTVTEARAAYYGEIAAKTRKALAANRLDEARVVTEAMLKKHRIPVAELSPNEWQRARQAVLRAGIDVAEAIQARYVGDFNHEPHDALLRRQLDTVPLVATPPASV